MSERPIDPTMVGGEVDEGAVRRRSSQAEEPSWLLAMRLDALARFQRLGPDRSWPSGAPWLSPAASSAPSRTSPRASSDLVELPPELAELGVIVEPLDAAVVRYPDLVRPHLGSVVTAAGRGEGADPWLDRDAYGHHDPSGRDRAAALNGAMWSGGTFIHVPAGVVVTVPIQATSRSRAASLGRHDRTLLVAEAGSVVHYIEGCSAPIYAADPLRCSVVEVVVGRGASVTHTAIQNWSANVVNLVAKGGRVEADGQLTWIDGNIGSRYTSTGPTVHLAGRGASAAVRSVTVAEADQRHDIGARMIHAAAETRSSVEAKVIADRGGVCHHHGRVEVAAAATGAAATFTVDGLLLDDQAEVDTSLDRQVDAEDATIEDRSASAPPDDGQLRYLASRGLPAAEAEALLANGFIEPVTRRLPVEFAVEWNRLIELQRSGSVG